MAGRALTSGTTSHVVEVDGRTRRFILHVPRRIARRRARPMIVALHGGGSQPQALAHLQLERLGRRAGFVIAYPAAFRTVWRAGGDYFGPLGAEVDDVAFIRALLDAIEERIGIDPARVFALGFSNGGSMAYRVACEMADRIAAIAVGAGSLEVSDCQPARPVPVIAFHGTADPFVPYAGGVGEANPLRFPFLGAPESVRRWAVLNGCANQAETIFERGAVTAIRYGGCAAGADVILYTVDGMGHQWPGHPIDLTSERVTELTLPQYLARLGPGNSEIDATRLALRFFLRHQMS